MNNKCDRWDCPDSATRSFYVEVPDMPVDLSGAYCDVHYAIAFPKQEWIKNPKGDVCSLCANFKWNCECMQNRG
mgnify:CR=1 FL=1